MSNEKYCWDSDVFITLLKGNDPDRTGSEIQALREAVAAFDAGRIILVAPTTIYSEVLEPLREDSIREQFERMTRRTNFVMQDITQEIGKMSGRIRRNLKDNYGRKMGTPDSQYVATAIVHGCDALHTFDGPLRRLSGYPEVSGLKISKPEVEQTELDLGGATEGEAPGAKAPGGL